MNFQDYCKELETLIEKSYEEGVTLEEAEKLAARFLTAQLAVSKELTKVDLDSRMKKSGLKAIRAAIYMDAATKDPKKPSDVLLQALVDMSEIVQTEQINYDKADVERAELERLYDVFLNAHIYYRGVAKGNFNG